MENNNVMSAIQYAVDYLSYKSRTEKEVRDKLLSSGKFEPDTISEAIIRLKQLNYIDDAKYAELFALSKSAGKMDGKRKIMLSLMQKGIDGNIAKSALEAVEESGELNEAANAEKLMRKKIGSAQLPLDRREKKKVFDYMARKGYSFSAINEAFNAIGDEISIDEWD